MSFDFHVLICIDYSAALTRFEIRGASTATTSPAVDFETAAHRAGAQRTYSILASPRAGSTGGIGATRQGAMRLPTASPPEQRATGHGRLTAHTALRAQPAKLLSSPMSATLSPRLFLGRASHKYVGRRSSAVLCARDAGVHRGLRLRRLLGSVPRFKRIVP